jgi:ribulose-phosphate 3-epimerase
MKIWASITSIDLGEFVDVAMRLQESGLDGIHVDICDGVFVPDFTFGHRVVRALTSRTTLPVEAHLMVAQPESFLTALADAGAARIAFHIEATRYPWRVAGLAADLGMQVGLAINPATLVPQLSYLSGAISFVNVLTTEPDTRGELLLSRMEQRVRHVVDAAGSAPVQVDGGMSLDVLGSFASAGASEFVIGRSLVGADDLSTRMREFRQALAPHS